MGTRTRQLYAASRVIASGEFGRYGGGRGASMADRFEQELAAAFGTPHALAVNSGTNALTACLAAMQVGPGDEVLVPAYTWVSSAAAAVMVGAVPILVEIDESLTMDPADLEAKITPRTRAIIPVHMLNLPADLETVLAIGAHHGIPVLEDACQAVGVRYKGRALGTYGTMGAYSFNQHKNIRSGEGGGIVTADDELFERACQFHDVGSYQRPGADIADHAFVGLNMRMPELSAAVLRPQLAALDDDLKVRSRRREMVADAVSSVPGAHIAPHHDEASAVALSLVFDDPEVAARFASAHGAAQRLIDTGRHVYSNWASILAKRTFDDRANPWHGREVDYVDSCPATISILERSVHLSTRSRLPLPVFARRARAMGQWRP